MTAAYWKKHWLLLFIEMLLSFFFTSCGVLDRGDLILDAGDNGRSIEVENGDVFKLSLEGNPTTGFQWDVTAYNAEMLTRIGEPEYNSDSDKLGAGGIYTFTFKALAEGQSNLELVYHRPWEEGALPIRNFYSLNQCKIERY